MDLPQIGYVYFEQGYAYNRVMIRTFEWGESQHWRWASEWENLSSRVGFTVASEWGFCPISGAMNLV